MEEENNQTTQPQAHATPHNEPHHVNEPENEPHHEHPAGLKNKWPFITIAILILLMLPFVGYFLMNQTKSSAPAPTPITPPDQKACSQEAKICPDGTSVGRTGPNCEFAVCPTPTTSALNSETADWKIYTKSESGYSIKYPSENYVRLICPDEELVLKARTAQDTKDEVTMETCGRGGRFEIEVVSASSFTEPTTDEFVSVTKEEITVAGTTARKYISTKKPAAEGPVPDYSEDIYLDNGGKKHLIHFGSTVSDDIKNKILSTFKFL